MFLKQLKTTSISLELKSKMGNYDIENNDNKEVLDNVKSTFDYIDRYNITLILPILNDENLSILEKIDTFNFSVIDRVLGSIINTSYNVLTHNNISVLPSIILINNDRYKTFINWFTSKYNGRVVCKNMLEVIHTFNVTATTYKKVETPVMNFVVGSYNTEIDVPIKEEKIPVNGKQQLQPQHSYGFASYYVLTILALLVGAIVILLAF